MIMAQRANDQMQICDHQTLIDEACRTDFMSFLMGCYPRVHGGANVAMNWHLEAVGYQLERIRRGECRRLIINLPPRALKSFTVSTAWVAWMLGVDPTLNIVCVSYSSELAGKMARDCRAIMMTDWFKRLFPGTVISKSRNATHDFETTRGGGRLATSVGGTLTGRGGDIIIIDDPIKPDEVRSDTTRNAVNEWFSSTLATRLNDKNTGAILTVMQRLHQYDLTGMLLEDGGEDWTHLSLSAIAQRDAIIPLTGKRVHHFRAGEYLHPEREGYEVCEKMKSALGSMYFAAQYLQEPVPAQGNLVKADWLLPYDTIPEAPVGQIVQSWDTASKEGVFTDYSVCVTARIVGRKVYILDVWRKKVPFPELRKAAIELAQHFRAQVMLIEDQSSGTQLWQSLLNDTPRGVPTPTRRKPEGDKLTRLSGVTAMIERGELLLPSQAPWLAEFKRELLGFPSMPKDDQVDALSQLLIWADLQQRFSSPTICGPTLYMFDRETGAMEVTGDIEWMGFEEGDEPEPTDDGFYPGWAQDFLERTGWNEI
jgi:predicted phage terminase large subunit-like protein